MEGAFPTIECVVTFLTVKEDGRSIALPANALTGCQYRPHLVVGDPRQREVITDGNRKILENYLGVCFLTGPESPEFIEMGKPLSVIAALMY